MAGLATASGTLFAFENACALAAKLYDGVDLAAAMRNGASVALYHTAGKGTRLAPLPGAESNNKPVWHCLQSWRHRTVGEPTCLS